MAWVIKQHDTWPPLVATLTDQNGAINLTTATSVKFIAKITPGGASITGTCAITTPASGIVTYTWGGTDTATVGAYSVEFEITWTGGAIETVPNSGSGSLTIEADLG